MPRTIESIVHCHRIARERRQAGRRIWDHRVPLKEVLGALRERRDRGETIDDASVAKACCDLADLLKARLPARFFDITHADYDRTLDDIHEGLADITAETFQDDPSYSLLKHLDGKIEELYDWGDYARVWLG